MMMKHIILTIWTGMLALATTMPANATVVVSSPSNGSAVSSRAQFTASATTSACSHGVASMGIYVDGQLVYVVNGASLNTSLVIAPGSHYAYVQEWDYCNGSSGTAVQISMNSQNAVVVTSPASNSTVSSSVNFVASATTSCAGGVTAMGVYVDNQLSAVTQGASLNSQLTLPSGAHQAVVQSWDACGDSAKQSVNLNVQASSINAVQAAPNWDQWGELAPVYAVCSPCSGVTWNMTQHESAVSLSGNATRFDIGGSIPYSDVLWSNKLIGQGSTENMPDSGETILPAIHNLSYDTDVFVTNWNVTQDLEFDINMYIGGVGMEWGTECNHLADGDWDVWDNVNAHWVSTGAPCSMNNNAWNHVSVQVQRLSDNSLLYQSITVNGVTYNINKTFPPFSVPGGWYGMTVNFQMDGNYRMAANTAYLDNLNVSYW